MDGTTVTILIGFLALAAGQIGTAVMFSKALNDTNKRFDDTNKRFDDMNKRFDDTNRDMNMRFDNLQRQIGELRERMAKLEGSVEGFLAGHRDRNAA